MGGDRSVAVGGPVEAAVADDAQSHADLGGRHRFAGWQVGQAVARPAREPCTGETSS
ncbi:hypothetical protein ACWDFL_14740 [Streptomyces bungoensis]